jgi:hypothetical protein
MPSNGVVEDLVRSITRFGIVAGMVDSLKFFNRIDTYLPKNQHHHLSHGQVTKSMFLNGLGFVIRRLYLFPNCSTTLQ